MNIVNHSGKDALLIVYVSTTRWHAETDELFVNMASEWVRCASVPLLVHYS